MKPNTDTNMDYPVSLVYQSCVLTKKITIKSQQYIGKCLLRVYASAHELEVDWTQLMAELD